MEECSTGLMIAESWEDNSLDELNKKETEDMSNKESACRLRRQN